MDRILCGLYVRMIRVLIELEIVFPYKKSINILSEFCNLWDCGLLEGGTNRPDALISMPSGKFKKMFGTNPRIGEYNIPTGAEHFIKKWNVKEIIIKE